MRYPFWVSNSTEAENCTKKQTNEQINLLLENSKFLQLQSCKIFVSKLCIRSKNTKFVHEINYSKQFSTSLVIIWILFSFLMNMGSSQCQLTQLLRLHCKALWTFFMKSGIKVFLLSETKFRGKIILACSDDRRRFLRILSVWVFINA